MWTVARLAAHHDRSNFACGTPALDNYFATLAEQDQRRQVASVFVAAQGSAVSGFYTLAMAGIDRTGLPLAAQDGLPKYQTTPAIRLGRLAVATSAQGQGLGRALLADAIHRALLQEIAWAVFLVDAKDDGARTFNLKHHFLPLADDSLHLYLPRATAAAVFGV